MPLGIRFRQWLIACLASHKLNQWCHCSTELFWANALSWPTCQTHVTLKRPTSTYHHFKLNFAIKWISLVSRVGIKVQQKKHQHEISLLSIAWCNVILLISHVIMQLKHILLISHIDKVVQNRTNHTDKVVSRNNKLDAPDANHCIHALDTTQFGSMPAVKSDT